jgi:hypothetical protein
MQTTTTRSATIKNAVAKTVETWFDNTIASAAARLEQGMTAGAPSSTDGEDRSFLMYPFINGGY